MYESIPVGVFPTTSSEPRSDEAPNARLALDLLRSSLDSLETNRESATQYILKACSVLESVSAPQLATSEGVARGALLAWQVRRVKEFVQANIGKTLRARDLSASVRLGPSYFQRAFKRSFGTSPHAFVLQRRIERAQHLMLTTQDPLSEIALAAGFSDQAHFTTRFRVVVGMPPSLWRRQRADALEHRAAA